MKEKLLHYLAPLLKRRSSRRAEVHVVRDWFIILCAGTLVLLGLFMFSGYVYVDVQQDIAVESAPTSARQVPLDEVQLTNVVVEFGMRAQRFDQLRTGTVEIPSVGRSTQTSSDSTVSGEVTDELLPPRAPNS